MIDPGLEDLLVQRLAAFAAAEIGFSEEAIRPGAIRQALREELRKGSGSLDDLVKKLQDQDALLLGVLRSAMLVGETYFFRQVEHFEHLAYAVIPRLARDEEGPIRAWSAGCSTGEEAYSLAACFTSATPRVEAVVWGTNVSAPSLQVARGGLYSSWSARQSAPPPFPVHQPADGDRLRVLSEVQGLTRFVEHNLLEPAPADLGGVHVLFCRNVLSYFSAPAARIALGHLVDALAPGGYAFFGTMDVKRAPPGLEEAASGGLQVFRKPRAPARARTPTPPPRAPGHAPPPSGSPDPPRLVPPSVPEVELHVRALTRIERGDRAAAEQDLQELRRCAPGYLPGLLELSLLHLRNGRRRPAEELMRELLLRAEGREDGEWCEGPERLSVSFYRAAARALLAGPEGER